MSLWQAVQQQIERTDWVKLGLLGLWDVQWSLIGHQCLSMDSSQVTGQEVQLLCWLVPPLPSAISLCLSHLFVCFPAFVWTGDFLCKLQETRSLQKQNSLQNRLNAPQCGFIFSLCGSNVPATGNYHTPLMKLQGSVCMEYVSGADTAPICISLSHILQYANTPLGCRKS